MALHCYKLIAIGDQDFLLPLGRMVNITQGQWEFALKSVFFEYTADIQTVQMCRFRSNYVHQAGVNELGQYVQEETPLSVMLVPSGKVGSIKIIPIGTRDFFTIDRAEEVLRIKIDRLDDTETEPNHLKNMVVTIYILLRRVR